MSKEEMVLSPKEQAEAEKCGDMFETYPPKEDAPWWELEEK